MLRFMLLATAIAAGIVATQEVCTEIIVTGDDAEASCTCTCTCDVGCPQTTPSEVVTPPSRRRPCSVGHSSPNGGATFDGNQFSLDANKKFLLSQFNVEADDSCKFQVRLNTEDAPDGSGSQVEWAQVAFGVHPKNSAKFERAFRVSRPQGLVDVLGYLYPPTTALTRCYETGDFWTFCLTVSSPGVYDIRGEVPERGCWFTVHYEEGSDGANDSVVIDASGFYDGQLKGICGNRDGDPDDDGDHCLGYNSCSVSAPIHSR